MPINFKAMANKKAKQARVQDYCFDETGYRENRHFESALPEDALMMSSCGRAKGFDFISHVESYGKDATPVVTITKSSVQFLFISEIERNWIEEGKNSSDRKARKALLRGRNQTLWGDLLPINYEYLLSLLWIPVDPYNEMEILARAAL